MAAEPYIRLWDRPKAWFFRQSYLMRLLAFLMIAASAIFFELSWRLDGGWEGLFTDLAVTCLGVLLTVFLVERFQREDEARRWSKLEWFAKHEMNAAVTYSLRAIVVYDPNSKRVEMTSVPMETFRANPLGVDKLFYDNPLWRKNALEVAETEIEPKPYEFGVRCVGGDMRLIVAKLDESRLRLQDVISAYGDRLSPSQVEQVWSFQRLCSESTVAWAEWEKSKNTNKEAAKWLSLYLASLVRIGVCIIEDAETCDTGKVSLVSRDT